jgi:hypothetical protein
MRKNARRKGVRFIESIAIGAVVVDLNKFIVGVLLLSVVDPCNCRSERREENAESKLSLPCPGFRSF